MNAERTLPKVGDYVGVYWEIDMKYYDALVIEENDQYHRKVKYLVDGEIEILNFKSITYKFLFRGKPSSASTTSSSSSSSSTIPIVVVVPSKRTRSDDGNHGSRSKKHKKNTKNSLKGKKMSPTFSTSSNTSKNTRKKKKKSKKKKKIDPNKPKRPKTAFLCYNIHYRSLLKKKDPTWNFRIGFTGTAVTAVTAVTVEILIMFFIMVHPTHYRKTSWVS